MRCLCSECETAVDGNEILLFFVSYSRPWAAELAKPCA